MKPVTLDKKFHWNTEKPKMCAYSSTKIYETSENSTHQRKSHKIYASTAHMSSNAETPRIYFGDILQLNNWILDSCATCHMTPENYNFIPDSLEETDKYIKVADGIFTVKKQEKRKYKIFDDNGKPFIATLYNVILVPDLCD